MSGLLSAGVCTSVLKKVCHENGLVRWPYRKTGMMTTLCRGSQLENENSIHVQKMAKSRGILQQQGNKSIQNGRQQNLSCSNLMKETPSAFDEFKNGFPSDGLATVNNRWWGCLNMGFDEAVIENDNEDCMENDRSGELADGGFTLAVDEENSENFVTVMNRSKTTALCGVGLLSAVRKRAVEEGREVLKHNVYQSFGAERVGTRERTLLLRTFNSCLPT